MENLLKELNNILDEAEIKANKIKQLAEERKFKLQKVLDKIDPLADSLWDEIEKLYAENLKSSFFVCPTNEFIRKDDYMEIGIDALKEGYRVTGYDIISTPGVEYVTIDPVYLRDHSVPPVQKEEDDPAKFFWLNGGAE